MKNKYFLSFVILACVAVLACAKLNQVHHVYQIEDETRVACNISNASADNHAILCESSINFSVGTVKLTHLDNTKTQEKQLKYKLPAKENLKIEHLVENYIFFIEALTYYHDDLSELGRLNI